MMTMTIKTTAIKTTAINETTEPNQEAVSREQAIKRLKKRRDLYGHLLVYALVNGVLVVFWALTGPNGFFWPIFPILGWGIAVVLNAWDVYRSDAFSEEQIQREIEHLHRHR
jgi:hypothetical protein